MFAHISHVGVAFWDKHFGNVHSSRARERESSCAFIRFALEIPIGDGIHYGWWLIYSNPFCRQQWVMYLYELCALKWNCGNGYNIRKHIRNFSIVKMASNKSEPCHQMAFHEILFPLHMLLVVSAQLTRSIANFEWEKKEQQINLVESILCLFSSPFCIAFY